MAFNNMARPIPPINPVNNLNPLLLNLNPINCVKPSKNDGINIIIAIEIK